MHYLLLYLRNVFTLDLRALALLRIGMGALLLIDLFTRTTDLEAHYANMGVLPLSVLFEHVWNPYFFSFHTLSGLWQVQAVLFLMAAAFAVCLLLGYNTRTFTILSWLFLVSLQNRNTLISQGGDDLVRMLLFWGIFLPWGKYYSLDARKQDCPPATTTYFSAATVAFVLQFCLLYICTALLKNAPEWRTDGTALYYALSLDQILLPVGKLIYPYPSLLHFLTVAVFYTELLLPVLLLIPVYNNFFRMVVIGALLGLHLGISVTLFVGLFYLINLVSLLGLLPTPAMDWLEKKLLLRVSPAWERTMAFCNRFSNPLTISAGITWNSKGNLNRPLYLVQETFVTFVLLYTIWWNLDNIPGRPVVMPDWARWFGFTLRVDQHWGMFAPAVFKDDGWYILEGTTAAGHKIDLNREGWPVTYQKPRSVVSLFKNDRWRKYSENYLFVHNNFMRPYFCNYRLRVWNEKNATEKQVKSLEVVYMKEITLPDYKTAPVKREVLCSCGE